VTTLQGATLTVCVTRAGRAAGRRPNGKMLGIAPREAPQRRARALLGGVFCY